MNAQKEQKMSQNRLVLLLLLLGIAAGIGILGVIAGMNQ